MIFDPAKEKLDETSGEDDFNAIEELTPEIGLPEASGWPDSYFHSPWPLSENYFLVSFSFDPLPGMGSGVKKDTETGIYYFDRLGIWNCCTGRQGFQVCTRFPWFHVRNLR